jgi:hypothetical protein
MVIKRSEPGPLPDAISHQPTKPVKKNLQVLKGLQQHIRQKI